MTAKNTVFKGCSATVLSVALVPRLSKIKHSGFGRASETTGASDTKRHVRYHGNESLVANGQPLLDVTPDIPDTISVGCGKQGVLYFEQGFECRKRKPWQQRSTVLNPEFCCATRMFHVPWMSRTVTAAEMSMLLAMMRAKGGHMLVNQKLSGPGWYSCNELLFVQILCY